MGCCHSREKRSIAGVWDTVGCIPFWSSFVSHSFVLAYSSIEFECVCSSTRYKCQPETELVYALLWAPQCPWSLFNLQLHEQVNELRMVISPQQRIPSSIVLDAKAHPDGQATAPIPHKPVVRLVRIHVQPLIITTTVAIQRGTSGVLDAKAYQEGQVTAPIPQKPVGFCVSITTSI